MDLMIELLKVILSKIVSDEFVAGCPTLAQWLVKRSVRLLRIDKQGFEERWLADLEDRKTPLRKLLFAIKICVIAIRLYWVTRHVPSLIWHRLRRAGALVYDWVILEQSRRNITYNDDGSVTWVHIENGFAFGGVIRPLKDNVPS